MTYYRTVKLKVAEERMSGRELRRLRQQLHRDHRVIQKVLGIIHANRKEVVRGIKVDRNRLHELVYTSRQREEVSHDLKEMFPRSHPNSLLQCKRTAEKLYNNYLARRVRGKTSYPRLKRLTGTDIFYPRFSVNTEESYLSVIDSMDSQLDVSLGRKSRTKHPRLKVYVELYEQGRELLEKGSIKSAVFFERDGLWVSIAVELEQEKTDRKELPTAVLGIDLGLKKPIVCSLLTKSGVRESKTYIEEERMRKLLQLVERRKQLWWQFIRQDVRQLSRRLASVLEELPADHSILHQLGQNLLSLLIKLPQLSLEAADDYLEQIDQLLAVLYGEPRHYVLVLRDISWYLRQRPNSSAGLRRKITQLSTRISQLKRDIDRRVVNRLLDYIRKLLDDWNLYVVIGDVRGIRRKFRKSTSGRKLRHMIHQWSYGRIYTWIELGINKLGLADHYLMVKESYTSIRCHRCGKRGLRPKQSRFVCSYERCGWQGNADLNGATNIALIATRQVAELGHFQPF